jgi:hypothetical protein
MIQLHTVICGVPVVFRPFLWGLYLIWDLYKNPQNMCALNVLTFILEASYSNYAQVGLKLKLK